MAAHPRRALPSSRASRLYPAAILGLIAGVLAAPVVSAAPGDNRLVSVQFATPAPAGDSDELAYLSGDGRYVAFSSRASTLVPGDTNGHEDAFLRDLATGITARISLGLGGVEADGDSRVTSISKDGRYVVFQSTAGNLVPGDDHAVNAFLYDRVTRTTRRASNFSVYPDDAYPLSNSSNDGRFVVFARTVRDLQQNTTEPICVDYRTGSPVTSCVAPVISGNGRFVVFASSSPDLVAGDANERPDLFVRDRWSATTERIHEIGAGDPNVYQPAISSDGRWIAAVGGTSGAPGVFLFDRLSRTLRLASTTATGEPGDGQSDRPAISDDGRFVAFASYATNLAPHDGYRYSQDVFLKDMQSGAIEQVNLTAEGYPSDRPYDPYYWPALTNDGRFVAFTSVGSNFVPNDAVESRDVFVHETGGPQNPIVYSYTLRPLAQNFGTVRIGAHLTKWFTLVNTGNAPLPIIGGVVVAGRHRNQFQASYPAECDDVLPIGARCLIPVTFSPTRLGDKHATLVVRAGWIERHRGLNGTAVP
jgi:Tol biopolymer transport system component